MDRETRDEFRKVWKRMEQYDKDSRDLIRVSESVKGLAKKVSQFSLAVTGLATAIVADIVTHYLIK